MTRRKRDLGHDASGDLSVPMSSVWIIFLEPGVVHRLDRDTSGVLVLAKTQAAFAHLKSQFHNRLVQKEYRAFVYGYMREAWGTIDRPIGRSAS